MTEHGGVRASLKGAIPVAITKREKPHNQLHDQSDLNNHNMVAKVVNEENHI